MLFSLACRILRHLLSLLVRLWFAALSRFVPRRSWAIVFPVTPASILRY
jgi:hypothetical protein